MVSEEARSNINYMVYAYNTLDSREIAYNIPNTVSVEDIDEVLKEDFGVESRKIENGVHPDYLGKVCTY